MASTQYRFTCGICDEPIGDTHLCLDRRVEKASVMTHDGKPVNAIAIAERETLVMYCSHQCWQDHEPALKDAMALLDTYPSFSFVTPCCRCGKAVNRTHAYVCYSISEMEFQDGAELIARCLDDHDYAVLCLDCEGPGTADNEERSVLTEGSLS